MIRLWLIIAATLITEVVIRFALDLSFESLLLSEAILLMTAGGVVYLKMYRAKDLAVEKRPYIAGLSVFLVLGSLRSFLWWAGVPVEFANLAVLGAVLTMVGAWWYKSRGLKRKESRDGHT